MSDAAKAGLSDASRQQLQALLERVARIANAVRPWARGFTGLGLLGALWLAWTLQTLTTSPYWVAGIILFILMLPTLVCGWFWWLMVDVSELPEIAERTLGIIRSKPDPAQPSAGVGDAFRMGGSLRKAAGLAWEIEGLHSVIVGAMVLANPIFLLVLGVSILVAVGLGVIGFFGFLLGLIF